jgi:hypothetical protein
VPDRSVTTAEEWPENFVRSGGEGATSLMGKSGICEVMNERRINGLLLRQSLRQDLCNTPRDPGISLRPTGSEHEKDRHWMLSVLAGRPK